ncbi:MAG TPA: spermidine/putrescine ABC transporter ATP-binding protein [Phycisphaerales bacterium]|nr:spermidine/putrescine ABC transporter ATP-binding protein [Phycisphaerales bacterium]
MPTTIEIRGISKHYKSFGAGLTKAVDDVSLTVNAGDLFFLLGPSGCGKTTLLRMIAGFIEPTAGQILFNGRDISRTAPNKRNTGMVFQSYALWPHMTVAQNVAYGLKVRRIPRADRDRRVEQALAAVRMDPYAARKPNQLSGGQQQRVALARALVVQPDVLLLDEPLSNLDAKLRLEMRAEIRRICKEAAITTVYVTHDQKEALSMADALAVLNQGVIAQAGPPREVYLRPRSRFVAEFLGETNFIPGRIESRSGAAVTVSTPAGPLLAAETPGPAASGAVTCSIRPEAWKIVPDGAPGTVADHPRTVRGTVRHSDYLGELALHTVDLRAPDGAASAAGIKVFELHPSAASMQRREIALAVEPHDVVLLSE